VDFSDALREVRIGRRVKRAESDWILSLPRSVLVDGRKISSVLLCEYPNGILLTFAGGHIDLLAQDWEVVV
jgi:hypothetical protein